MEKGKIKITEYLYCKCGYPIKVLHNQGNKTCRADGLRFVDMKRPDDGGCLFSCPICARTMAKNNLMELGAL